MTSVLDVGRGPGRELRRGAELVPQGEAVGIAHAGAAGDGLDNCTFVQARRGDLPHRFRGRFDVVFSCVAHHHFPNELAAAREALRCLRLSERNVRPARRADRGE